MAKARPGEVALRKVAQYRRMLNDGIQPQPLQSKTFRRVVNQHGVQVSKKSMKELQRIVEMHTIATVTDAVYLQKLFGHKTLSPDHMKAILELSKRFIF